MIHTEVHIEMTDINQKGRTESEFGAIIAIVVAMVLKPRKCLFNTLTLLQNYWYTGKHGISPNNTVFDKENHQ